MLSSYGWIIWNITRRLWFRASLVSLLAVAAAVAGLGLSPYLPDDLSAKIGADAVQDILNVLASSMLVVTTFSLSTMVAAYAAAGASAPPRATKLLLEDTTTQNVLATFVGSFLYSLVAIIVLATGAYGERGRVVLFAVTMLVVLLIVVTLLRWIDYLLGLGRVGETARQVEDAAERAIRNRARRPCLGGTPWSGDPRDLPAGARRVFPEATGYVANIDMKALADVAAQIKGEIYVAAPPGSFVDPGLPILYAAGPVDDAAEARLCGALSIEKERTFEQDPAYGLGVMAEIASRALSPGVNDAGTALDAIGRAVRVLLIGAAHNERGKPEMPAVHMIPVTAAELFDAFFPPVARDGAKFVEIQTRLQAAFAILSRCGDDSYREQAMRHARLALERAEAGMAFEPDLQAVRAAHRETLAVGQDL